MLRKICPIVVMLLFALSILFSGVSSVYAATTDQIGFQYKLVNSNGTNVSNRPYSFRFLMYSSATGGTALWSEDQTLSVTDGIVNVKLGSVNSFPANLFDNTDLYVQVCLDSNNTANDSSDANCGTGVHSYEEVFTQREPVTSVPVAFRASRANALIDGSGNTYTSDSFLKKSLSDTWNQSQAGITLAFNGSTQQNLLLVDGTNNKIGFNNISYSFPVSQGAASTVLTNDGSGNLSWAAGGSGSSVWSALTNPTANLSLSMANNTTSFTWGTATGATNMFSLADTASNTGTGSLLNVQTATGSAASPLHVTAGTNESIYVSNTGAVSLGSTSGPALGIFKLSVTGDIGPASAPTAQTLGRTTTALDTTGNVGLYTSIKVAPNGHPILAYYDATNGNLKYIYCGNDSCSSGNSVVTLDGTGVPDVGQYASLIVGSDGLPLITYYDVTNGDLKVAHCNEIACSTAPTITSVDSTGNVGQFTSVVVSKDGFPVIAYYDVTNGDLKVAKCGNVLCSTGNTITTVDATGNVGQYTAIILDNNGFPMIAYEAITNIDAKIAACNDYSCSSSTITDFDAPGNRGSYMAIVMTTDSAPVMAYYDSSGGGGGTNLRVSKCSNTKCTAVTSAVADAAGDIGQYTSMAMGTDALYPVIAYYDVTNGDLKVVKCASATSCTGSTPTSIDTTGNVGQYTSIVFSQNDGNPIISYYDVTNGDLKVTKCANPDCSVTPGAYFAGGYNIGSPSYYFNNVYAVRFWAKEGLSVANFDLAEDYNVLNQDIIPGEVVSIAQVDGDNIMLQRSDSQYDKNVIGVVSTKPAVRLTDWNNPNGSDKNTKPIALSGRVPVLVTSENGDIKKGDRLVAASRPGYAMNACGPEFCKPGRSIGISLNDVLWKRDEGDIKPQQAVITVFVNVTEFIPTDTLKDLNNANFILSAIKLNATDKVEFILPIVATKADIAELISKKIQAEEITAQKATIDEIDAKSITAEDVKGVKVTAGSVNTDSLTLSKNTAGKAIIKSGKKSITVTTPNIFADSVVIATLTGDQDIAEAEVHFTVSVHKGEFTIFLNKAVKEDLTFNWIKVEIDNSTDQ